MLNEARWGEVESMGVVCKGISIRSDEKRSELYEFSMSYICYVSFFFIGFGIFFFWVCLANQLVEVKEVCPGLTETSFLACKRRWEDLETNVGISCSSFSIGVMKKLI